MFVVHKSVHMYSHLKSPSDSSSSFSWIISLTKESDKTESSEDLDNDLRNPGELFLLLTFGEAALLGVKGEGDRRIAGGFMSGEGERLPGGGDGTLFLRSLAS